jgi:hypothetical protein
MLIGQIFGLNAVVDAGIRCRGLSRTDLVHDGWFDSILHSSHLYRLRNEILSWSFAFGWSVKASMMQELGNEQTRL